MARGYDDAADAAKDRGYVERADVQDWAVRQGVERFLNVEDPAAPEAQKLIDETVERAMNQEVRFDNGATAGKRRNLTVWEDRWGNVMAQNAGTGTRRKLVDSEERGFDR